jgi:superoxide reductase
MKRVGDLFKTDDWKTEKHIPAIECIEKVKAGEWIEIKVTIGKEIDHPNTTEHHIRWIQTYFLPEGTNFAYDLGKFELNSHGESTMGPNKGPCYTQHSVNFTFKTSKSGTIFAISYCNIHGLWENSKKIIVS